MQNVTSKLVGTKLHIEIDLSKPGEKSASGKSMVIASTKGNQVLAQHGGKNITVGLNVYTPAT